MDAADELLASILAVAGCIKKREDRLRRTTRDFRTRVEKCIEVGGGILGTFIVSCNRFLEHLLWTVTDFGNIYCGL